MAPAVVHACWLRGAPTCPRGNMDRPTVQLFVTVKQFAAMAHVSPSTVRRMIKSGQLRTVRLSQRCIRIVLDGEPVEQ